MNPAIAQPENRPSYRAARANFAPQPRTSLTALICAAALISPGSASARPAAEPAELASVVVLAESGQLVAAERSVANAGGRPVARVRLVGGLLARVPAGVTASLRSAPGVRAVTPDRKIRPRQSDAAAPAQTDLPTAAAAVGADLLHARGTDGSGVDVALIDSGVAPVAGLAGSGKVVAGPDLSSTADDEDLRSLDAFGHGTHLAGIIASVAEGEVPSGLAPGARLVNVKVADPDGATTLGRLLLAIDWVVRNRQRDGLDIRVLNLSFGSRVSAGYRSDPLSFAAERAWKRGITVVAAAGNGGEEGPGLDSPAADPYVIAVGADDASGTAGISDDAVPVWSSRGDGVRNPDVIAPGTGIVSLRVPGGWLDEEFPGARVGDSLFRGSGTSQATAVVSGVAALMISARPELEPDQVKALLTATARPLPGEVAPAQGAGLADAAAAAAGVLPKTRQHHPAASADGEWRGAGEPSAQLAVDPRASRWSASRWSASRWSASRWSASRWSASRWSASRWSASRWSASRWSASRWSASRWSGTGWD